MVLAGRLLLPTAGGLLVSGRGPEWHNSSRGSPRLLLGLGAPGLWWFSSSSSSFSCPPPATVPGTPHRGRRQPLRHGDPRPARRQLHPALLAPVGLSGLLGGGGRARGVRPLPPAGAPEPGGTAGCVHLHLHLQRGGGEGGGGGGHPCAVRPAGAGGAAGRGGGPPEHVGDHGRHAGGVHLAGGEEEGGHGAEGLPEREGTSHQRMGLHSRERKHGGPPGAPVLPSGDVSAQHAASTQQHADAVNIFPLFSVIQDSRFKNFIRHIYTYRICSEKWR